MPPSLSPSEMFRASPKRSESVKFVEFAAQSAMAAAATITAESGGVSRNHRLQRQPHFAHCDNAAFLFAALSKLEEEMVKQDALDMHWIELDMHWMHWICNWMHWICICIG